MFQLFRKEVRYLGQSVSLEAVKNCPNLTDKHQLRGFLGPCTYYRRFIAGFADIAKPVTRLKRHGHSSGPLKQRTLSNH
jgi:hypothetical protein